MGICVRPVCVLQILGMAFSSDRVFMGGFNSFPPARSKPVLMRLYREHIVGFLVKMYILPSLIVLGSIFK